jgi:hypothetical protein
MNHLNCGAIDENRQANRQQKAGKASERDGMLPSYKERTKRETRGRKKRPANHPSVCLSTEVRRKRGTLFLPHKPTCAGAYAAKALVLRFRLRWIIHPGVFISPVT